MIRRQRTTDYELQLDERCPVFLALGWVMQIQNVKIAVQTQDYERRGGEGSNTQKCSCFYVQFTKMQVFCMWSYVKNNEKILPYLVKKLRRVKLVNKVLATQFLFFRPWIPMWNMKKINRNSNSSFIKLRRWTSPITDVACSRSKCRDSMISKMFTSYSSANAV